MNEPQDAVSARVADLATLKMSELWKLWDKHLPRRPDFPNRLHVQSRIAYKIQEEAYGGLDVATRRQLEAIGQRHSKIKLRAPRREFHFAPGTVIMREWDDREHRVKVNARGQFEYEGQDFKSLTAVARHITGAHCSGPAFFGLTKEA